MLAMTFLTAESGPSAGPSEISSRPDGQLDTSSRTDVAAATEPRKISTTAEDEQTI